MKRKKSVHFFWIFCLLILFTVSASAQNTKPRDPVPPDLLPLQEGGFVPAQWPAPPEGSANLFALEDLTDVVAQRLKAAMRACEATVDLSDLKLPYDQPTATWLSRIYNACLDFFGEFYYVAYPPAWDGKWDPEVNDWVFSWIRIAYRDELLPTVPTFHAKIDEILDHIPDGLKDEEVLLYLHDYLVRNVAYNWQVHTSKSKEEWPPSTDLVWTAYGALVEGNSVCQGYSEACAILLNRLGFPNAFAHMPNHVWNLVQLNGQWYHIDNTWDDKIPDCPGTVEYDYFLLPTDVINDPGHHQVSCEIPAGIECTDRRYLDPTCLLREAPGAQIHYWNGFYYELRPWENQVYMRYGFWSDAFPFLQVGPTESILPGNLWRADQLFLFSYHGVDGPLLQQVDLTTRETRILKSQFFFTQKPSPDGAYPAERDLLGMKYDKDAFCLRFWSSNRPLTTKPPYANGTPRGICILPKLFLLDQPRMRDQQVKVSFLCGKDPAVNATLWGSFYNQGRLVSMVQASGQPGNNDAAFPAPASDSWDFFKCFLADANQAPLCTSRTFRNPALSLEPVG